MLEVRPEHDEDDECPEFERRCGDSICGVCGKLYYDHPQHPRFGWLNLLCDGTYAKL